MTSFSEERGPSSSILKAGRGLTHIGSTRIWDERTSRPKRLHVFRWLWHPEDFIAVEELKALPLKVPLHFYKVDLEQDRGQWLFFALFS